jgi:hypothetical protein
MKLNEKTIKKICKEKKNFKRMRMKSSRKKTMEGEIKKKSQILKITIKKTGIKFDKVRT